MNESKIETIKGLLAKAESTTNAHEAEAFTLKATDLMIKYGIEQAMLDSKATRKEAIEVRPFRIQDPYADVLIEAVYTFARSYNKAIDGYYTGRATNDRTLHFVGYASDLELLHILLASLMIQSKAGLERWINEQGAAYMVLGRQARWHERRAYLKGFFRGAGDKVEATRREAEASSEPGTAIVLASRAEAVRADMASRNLGKSRGTQTRGYSGGMAGRRDGRNADLAQSNIASARRGVTR